MEFVEGIYPSPCTPRFPRIPHFRKNVEGMWNLWNAGIFSGDFAACIRSPVTSSCGMPLLLSHRTMRIRQKKRGPFCFSGCLFFSLSPGLLPYERYNGHAYSYGYHCHDTDGFRHLPGAVELDPVPFLHLGAATVLPVPCQGVEPGDPLGAQGICQQVEEIPQP